MWNTWRGAPAFTHLWDAGDGSGIISMHVGMKFIPIWLEENLQSSMQKHLNVCWTYFLWCIHTVIKVCWWWMASISPEFEFRQAPGGRAEIIVLLGRRELSLIKKDRLHSEVMLWPWLHWDVLTSVIEHTIALSYISLVWETGQWSKGLRLWVAGAWTHTGETHIRW